MGARVRDAMMGVKGDECDCGRRASVRHCNSCGSMRVYARQNRHHTFLNGETKAVDVQFRCQSCGHLFVEEERQFCDAPPVSIVLAKLKVQRLAEARKQGEYLNPKEAQLADIVEKIQEHSPAQEAEFAQVTKDMPSEYVEKLKQVEVDPLPEGFVLPQGLTRVEYDVADRAFRLEWAQKRLMGNDTGLTVQEYVERRLKGELFE